MKKLMLSFATVALAVASAANHKVMLYQATTISGTDVKPGQYRLELKDNNKAVLINGKTQVEAQVTTETAESKFSSTTVRYANADGKAKLTEIRLGGTNTRIVFSN